jgi:hypothetical protein
MVQYADRHGWDDIQEEEEEGEEEENSRNADEEQEDYNYNEESNIYDDDYEEGNWDTYEGEYGDANRQYEADPAYAEAYHEEDPAEEKRKEKEKQKEKEKTVAAILCFCFCILLIVGITLGVVLGGSDESSPSNESPGAQGRTPKNPSQPQGGPPDPSLPPFFATPPSSTPPPTRFPTISPAPTIPITKSPTGGPSAYPTTAPTITPAPTKSIPDELFLVPDADTYVYTRGFYVAQAYGKQETWLVQNGPEDVNEIPDAFALLSFDLVDVPAPERILDRARSAILQLTHVPNDLDRGPRTYTIVRLPSTPLAIETLHGEIFVPPPDGEGPSFEVDKSDTNLEVDITDLVFGQSPSVQQENVNPDQLFLMIVDRGDESSAGGDRFRGRESDFPPILHIGLPPGGSPAPSKSSAPSRSMQPSLRPTLSAFPSQSMRPSLRPSTSVKPSAQPSEKPSAQPSVIPTLPPSTSIAPSNPPTSILSPQPLIYI